MTDVDLGAELDNFTASFCSLLDFIYYLDIFFFLTVVCFESLVCLNLIFFLCCFFDVYCLKLKKKSYKRQKRGAKVFARGMFKQPSTAIVTECDLIMGHTLF